MNELNTEFSKDLNDQMLFETVDVLKARLRKEVLLVTFKKVDGTVREMQCSLKENFLPKRKKEENLDKNKSKEDVLVVWDVDKDDWRSIRLQSIISVKTKDYTFQMFKDTEGNVV